MLSLLLACSGAPEAPKPDASGTGPNVLLITLDTTRADMIGAYGGPAGATPALDKLAQDGVRFDRAYTTTPLTIPAHSSLFTGLFPPRHGVRDNGDYFLDEGATTLAELLKNDGYATMASVGAEVTSHHWGFAQGFDAFFDEMGKTDKNRWRVERRGDLVAEDAIGWLADNNDTKWFAWVHLFDVHHPYEPPAPFDTQFAGRPYLGELAWTDSVLQALTLRLHMMGELDDTWIIVMADHGEGLGAHGEAMHGVLLYDPTTRIPLIIRPPKNSDITAGTVVTAPTSIVDVFPTVLSILGIDPKPDIDGRDLSPLLRGQPDTDPERAVYLESLYANRHYGWAPQKALVDANWKYIHSTTPELYAADDISETNDQLGSEPNVSEGFRTQLGALVEKMEPLEGVTGEAKLSADRLAQLAALGYVTGAPSVETEAGKPLPDPRDQLPLLRNLELARQAMQSGDLDGARAEAEAVLEQDPGLVEVRTLLATVLLQQKEHERAVEILQDLDEQRRSAPVKGMLGAHFLARGEPDLAEQYLSDATEIDPYFISPWMPLLHVRFMKGNPQELQETVREAVERFPDSMQVRGMQGMVAGMSGDFETAITLTKQSLEADPTQPFLNHSLGVSYRMKSDVESAERHLLEETRLYPPAIPSRRALVEIFADQQRYAEQIEQLEAIGAVEPPNLFTAHSHGQALFNLQRFEESKPHIDECIRMAPDYPACRMLLANILKKLGHDAEAQAAYELAIEMAGQKPPELPPQGSTPPPPQGSTPPSPQGSAPPQ